MRCLLLNLVWESILWPPVEDSSSDFLLFDADSRLDTFFMYIVAKGWRCFDAKIDHHHLQRPFLTQEMCDWALQTLVSRFSSPTISRNKTS